jgi:hypothetical protein
MKHLIISTLLICSASFSFAQKFVSKTGEATFFSHAPLEDIEAKNQKCGTQFIASANEIRVVIPIKGFIFEKSLMQAHFNENYMESDKFPVALFNGSIADTSAFNLKVPGEYSVLAKGTLMIHGVKAEREIPCKLTVIEGGKSINVTTEFPILLKDHDIKIPSAVGKNLAEEISVKYISTLDLTE